MGQFARQREYHDAESAAEYANAVQKWVIENTRLGIPVVFHDEILHGNMGERFDGFSDAAVDGFELGHGFDFASFHGRSAANAHSRNASGSRTEYGFGA